MQYVFRVKSGSLHMKFTISIIVWMMFIKAVQQIDPNGIDELLKKYELSLHSFRFKQLFLIILSVMQDIDRLTPISVSISTNEKGNIQWLEAVTFKKRNGVGLLGKTFL